MLDQLQGITGMTPTSRQSTRDMRSAEAAYLPERYRIQEERDLQARDYQLRQEMFNRTVFEGNRDYAFNVRAEGQRKMQAEHAMTQQNTANWIAGAGTALQFGQLADQIFSIF